MADNQGDAPEDKGEGGEGQSGEDNQKPQGDSFDPGAVLAQGFDPSIHAVDASGAPVRTVTGELRRKPGRKPGQKNGTGAAATGAVPAKAKKTKAENVSEQLSAEGASLILCGTVTGVLAELIGPEWQYQSEEERKAIVEAVAGYIRAKGDGFDLPPGVMLTLTIMAYSMVRLRHENTRGKLARFGSWLKSALGRVFKR